MKKPSETQASEDEVWSLIEEIGKGMLTTTDGSRMRARPMAAYPDQDEGLIWFLTDRRGHKDEEITDNPQVCVSFADPDSDRYVSLSGEADIVKDRAKLAELWNEYAKTLWPDGPDDPNVVLIRLAPSDAEYWEGRSNFLSTAFALAKARISGEKPDLGENRKVKLG